MSEFRKLTGSSTEAESSMEANRVFYNRNESTSNSPLKTYYSNRQVFSPPEPQRFPHQICKLFTDVFDDD